MSAKTLFFPHKPGRGLRQNGLYIQTAGLRDFLRQCVAAVLVGTTLLTTMPAAATDSNSATGSVGYWLPSALAQAPGTQPKAGTLPNELQAGNSARLAASSDGSGPASLQRVIRTDGSAWPLSGSSTPTNFFGQLNPLLPFDALAEGQTTAETTTTVAELKPGVQAVFPLAAIASQQENSSAQGVSLPNQASQNGIAMAVGFADSSSASANFPAPWNGAPNVAIINLGVSSPMRAGAIRLDNTTGSPITVDKVLVDLQRPNAVFDNLWGSFTIPANSSAILTQTAAGNFNTSAFPIIACGGTLAQNETRIPKITVTVAGTPTDYLDTAHVLDTGGFNLACRGNESLQWRPVGTLGIDVPGGQIGLAPDGSITAVGGTVSLTAQVNDAAGQPLANGLVTFNVLSGPDAGVTEQAVSDGQGRAVFSYTGTSAGADIVQAALTNFSGGSLLSNQVTVNWSSAGACPLNNPPAGSSVLIYVGQTSAEFGETVRLAALLTDGNGNALTSQPVSFSYNGQTKSATTDNNGVAQASVTATAVGTGTVTVDFTGNAGNQPAHASASLTIEQEETLLRYTGNTLLGTGTPQTVSAVLTDDHQNPIANKSLNFQVGAATATATTNAQGSAVATLVLPASAASAPGQLQISFAGDANYKASAISVPIDIFLASQFVVWGGNAGGLRLGQDVNFWGAQWDRQVTGGNYQANASFKGFADTVNTQQLCEVSAGTGGALDDLCWNTKPGNSFPPPTLPAFIEVIISNAIAKQGSEIYGNIAAEAICKVDPSPQYGPNPGHPGFCTLVAIVADGAGIFPKPAMLVANQSQPAMVLPNQTYTVNTVVLNSGSTEADSVTLNETFDGVTPPSGTATWPIIAAGGHQSASFHETTPAIPLRQSTETSVDYQSRLASLDGRLFTSTGVITFTDPANQPYLPVNVSSFSQLQIPRLTLAVQGPSCVSPGGSAPYVVKVTNIGSATATSAALLFTNPDGTVRTVNISNLAAGTSFSTTLNFSLPAIAPKSPNETTAQYLARLAAIDGTQLTVLARVNWTDALGNTYGTVEQPFVSTVERVPILNLTPQLPASVIPGQHAVFNFTVQNTGGGNAIQTDLNVTNPDGTLGSATPFSLNAGQSTAVQTNWVVPAIPAKQSGESDAAYLARLQAIDNSQKTASFALDWTDAASNKFGPTVDSGSTVELVPVVTINLDAPAEATAGDTITYTVHVQNIGHATASGVVVQITLPDGSTPVINLPASTLDPGAAEQGTLNFTIPTTQPAGPMTATANVTWKDGSNDGYGPLSSSASTTVKQANLPPVVDAGPNATGVPVVNQYPLQGSATDDGKPVGKLIINWTQVSGPSQAIFADPHSPTSTVKLDAIGTYVLRLAADDTQLQSSADVHITTVQANRPPIVNAGPDQTITLPLNTVTLNGSATDPQNSPMTFVWSQVSGPGTTTFSNPTALATTATFSSQGLYILRLTATDALNLTGSAEVRITVQPTNKPPLVNAGPDQTITLPLNVVTLNGSASDDGMPAGSVLKTTWSLLSGPGGVLFGDPSTTFTTALFTAPGVYVLRLTADDSQFRVSSDVTITVNRGGVDLPPRIVSQPITEFVLDPATAVPQIQDLTPWQVINYSPIEESQGPSHWVLDSTHTTATQLNNSDPSILLSDITLSNDTMEGTWAVNSNSDDDYIGFVFGFQDNQHFYLFDWKKGDQGDALGFAQRGMSVKVVNAGTPLGGFDFWPSGGNGNRVKVLYHNVIPWVSFTNYRFILTYRSGEFNITVLQGATVLASITLQDSTYPSGKFGFYNYSQDTVVYSGFQRTPLQKYTYDIVAVDPENDPISYSLVNGPAGMTVDPITGLLTWMVGNGDVGPHPVSVKAQEPSGQFDTQSYILNVIKKASVSPFGSIVLSPSSAGPLVVGTTQQLQAILKDGNGAPVANAVISFKVDGANATVGVGTTDATGKATFTYTGTLPGVDSVIASTPVGSVTLNSNTSTINWIVPVQPISTTTVFGRFFASDGSGLFNTPPTATPAFTQNFPTIDFNPPSGTVPGTPGFINVLTRPFTDVTTDLNGNFTGSIVAQGNGLQAGSNQLFNFQAVFTGTYTVAAAGDITFNFFSDDGFIFGVANGATRVGGSLFNPPPSGLTPFQNYPVMGAFNTATAPVANTVTVHFPAAGSYPYEVDYSECCAGQLALIMTSNQTGGHGVPPTGAITLIPGSDFPRPVGQAADFIALVTDASGAVLPNVSVLFNVAGTNVQQFQGVTDSTGKVKFTYHGFTTGIDIVQAQASISGMTAISNQTLVTWNAATNQPPVVNAGPDQTITLPQTTAILTGTATDDGLPNGTLTTAWSQVSGPAQASIGTPTQLSTTVTLPQLGTYVFQLTASDSALSSSSTVTVIVAQQNHAPSINITVDNTVITQPANTVTVTGTITDDGLPAGSTVTVQWTEVSGPAPVTFSDPASANTKITLTNAGSYVLKLAASDSQLSSFVNVPITVNPPAPNQAPVVSITASQTNITLPNNAVSLGAKVTDDGLPVGGGIILQWSEVSGPSPVVFSNPSGTNTQVGLPAAGSYVLQLAASDSQLTGSATITITVNPAGTNQQPTVAIIADRTAVTLPNNTVTLTGVVNDDGLPNGTISTQWSQLSGPAAVSISQVTPTSVKVAFPMAGVYGIQLTASDGQLSTNAGIGITVTSPGGNQPPTVNAGSNQTIQLPQNTVTLNGFAADDGLPAGSTLSIQWSEITGPAAVTFSTPNSAVTQATFGVAGLYVLQLQASDSQLQSTSQVTVTVKTIPTPPPPPPVVSITSPADDADLTSPTPVIGNVSNGDWKLEYAPIDANGASAFVQFASGSGAVTSSTLGTFDPTVLLNGQYAIRLTSTDTAGQSASATVKVGVSRNLKVGIFTLSFNDLSVPLPGLPITVTRTYDSRDKHVGDFGVGWTLSLANVRVQKNGPIGQSWNEDVTWSGFFPQYCLEPVKNHTLTLTFGDGRVYKFHAVSQPECQMFAPIEAPKIGFVQLPTGSSTAGATLTPIGDTDLILDGSIPGPQNILDFNAEFIDYTQFKLTTAEGYSYVIDQKLGVTSLTDPNGNSLTINANGITGSTGQNVAFTRDSLGRITSIQDPNGKSLTYAYSTAGDLASFTDRVGNVTTFSYDSTHLLTDILDPRGVHAIKNTYDASGRLISTTDASGNTTTYTQDLAANHEILTDRLGNSTLYEYDADGNVTRMTDPLGNITTSTYDANDNKLSETNALGKTTTYTYDSLGNQASVTDPLGHTTTTTYDSRKQPLIVTDPLGHVTTINYDSKGNLLTVKDPLGNTTNFTYSGNGRLTTTTDALGNTSNFAYDGNGNLIQHTDALGNVTSLTYNSNGNKLSQSLKRTRSDGTIETLTTTFQYDGNNRLIKTVNADGSTTQVIYNAIGKQSDTIDGLGHKTHFDYDDNGRLIKTTYPDGSSESHTYDANDRKISSTDRAGRVTSYTYDAIGRLTKTTYPDGSSTQTIYDAIGQTIKSIDALGNGTTHTYDDAQRETSVTDALGHVTGFSYNALGQQMSMTDALNHTTQFAYDNANRQVKITYADGTSESVTYDALGRKVAKSDQAGKTTQFSYDPLSRLLSVTDALGQVTKYVYDEVGSLINQTDANGHTTNFAYDRRGRPIQRKLPLSQTETYSYDAVGNLIGKTDFNGRTTIYSYDLLNRLTAKNADAFFVQNALGAAQVSFTYTATGRRASMSDASGTTTYTYDNRDRLVSKTTPAGTLTYEYDAAGNLLSIKSSNVSGASMTYGYDVLNRLATVNDASGATTYSYDAVGNLSGFTYPNGIAHSYSYDPLNRLVQMGATRGGTPVSRYAYALGAAGNRLSVQELSGRTVQYAYDNLYRLTSETISGAAQNGAISYQYDAVGNRLRLNSTVSAIPTGQLFYDANDRLLTDSYDNNGNPTLSGGIGYAYDFENRLVQRGAVNIVYDGDGNRVAETVAGVTTNYLVDTNNPTGYAQVLDELQSAVVTRTYSYGLELISERQNINGSLITSFYGFDGHGSVRQLFDKTGTVTDTYDYDAFGNLINSTGSTPNNYRFAGEQFDSALGFYFMRARYYDERNGRFWTMDSYQGDARDPMSLHKYLYVRDNPVNAIDPTGLFSMVEVTITGAIIGALAGATAYLVFHKGPFSPLGFVVWTLAGAVIGAAIAYSIWEWGPIALRWAGVSPLLARTWQQAEEFIEETLQIAKNTTTYIMNGSARIPDFIDAGRRFIADVKFTNVLSLSPQLRDYIAYATQNGYRFYIFCRLDTVVSQPLRDAVEATGGQIIRLLVR